MEKESLFGPTELSIKESLQIIELQARELTSGQTAATMKVK
jgi:hypothetical protein